MSLAPNAPGLYGISISGRFLADRSSGRPATKVDAPPARLPFRPTYIAAFRQRNNCAASLHDVAGDSVLHHRGVGAGERKLRMAMERRSVVKIMADARRGGTAHRLDCEGRLNHLIELNCLQLKIITTIGMHRSKL